MGIHESIQARIEQSRSNARVYKYIGGFAGSFAIGLALTPEISSSELGPTGIGCFAAMSIMNCLDAFRHNQSAAALEGALAQHQLEHDPALGQDIEV